MKCESICLTREIYVDDFFFFHVIKKTQTNKQWRTTCIEKCWSIIVYIVDIVILSMFYYEGMGFVSRLLFKQIVFIIHNKSCQVSFLIKASEMFNLLIFKSQKLSWHIEA